MPAQLNYTYDIPKGNPGGKFDIGFDEVVTRKNEEADGVLKYGMAVMTGSAPGSTVKVPTSDATTATIDGVALEAANTEHDLRGKVNVRQGASLSILRKGKVWGRLCSDAAPSYGAKAYVAVDGEEAGCFTSASAAGSCYCKGESTDSGAKEVVADSTESPTSSQIKLSAVTPAIHGYVPAIGDYVVSKQLHGTTIDIGAVFGNVSDDGIAVIEIR